MTMVTGGPFEKSRGEHAGCDEVEKGGEHAAKEEAGMIG